ncbi:hypothetical protein COEREDRAFT_79263 [Coemansia reversa NRRL 1564]|uniref:Uncharacterized protein n=1 Tax=Coemansia reversa (strain ATCC 12441 / NRRL 1564) TaxID=763665 RepID=A0A2G5BJZ3_COERN|nr:hypothetical protein COEREDRAFT_79263 [Coemansia reversa NRRL 1564]|eukprot:PIA19319.1 hypothetical protein COEREDRAFT_79263 [Coemansia reversa NRRL 1564]
MVDSLIKDANLALNCKPDDFPCGNDNTTNIRTIDAEYEPGLQISQSSEPDETATLVMDSSSGQRSRFASVSGPTHSMSRPASCGAENLTHAAAYSPSATHGTSPRTPRGRKSRHSAMLPIPSFADDPSEADAESDSVLGSFNTVSDRQSLHRNRPRTSHYRFQRSRRRKALEYPQGQSSRGVWNIERFGSNTTGPLQWNSSETCVSPRISEPPEHQLTPMMTPVCTQSQSLAKSICTPTRESHFDPGSSFSFKGLDKLAPHADLSVRNTQDFPYLASDEQTWRQQGVYASSGFSQDHEDLFFHRGYRPDTRAVLRSASILDERMDADMASLKGDRHCLDYDYVHIREEARARSNTYTTETSLTTAVPADAYTYESLHSSQANSDRREHVPREVSRKANSIGLQPSLSSMSPLHDCAVGRATYRSASSHYMTSIHHENPHATKNIAGFLSSPLVKRGTVNSCMDVLFPDLGDSECRRGDRMVSDSRGRGTGLISMFSLLYWTLLFTLGALMLDSFLCQVAGKHVMGTVDEIAHAETNNLSSPEDTSSSESCEKEDKAEYSIEHGKTSGSTNLANTVGRFVRWYVEEPQHISASNRDYPQTQKEHPRLIRMRKASAIRGSFKHIG